MILYKKNWTNVQLQVQRTEVVFDFVKNDIIEMESMVQLTLFNSVTISEVWNSNEHNVVVLKKNNTSAATSVDYLLYVHANRCMSKYLENVIVHHQNISYLNWAIDENEIYVNRTRVNVSCDVSWCYGRLGSLSRLVFNNYT